MKTSKPKKLLLAVLHDNQWKYWCPRRGRHIKVTVRTPNVAQGLFV